MPKKSIAKYEPQILLSRPQRNTRAKKVFDPSDNYIPKKRIKLTIKTEKPIDKFLANNNIKTLEDDSLVKKAIEKTNILKKPIYTDIVKKSVETNNVKKSIETRILKKHVKYNIKSKIFVKSCVPINGFNNTHEVAAHSSNKNKNDYFDDNPVSTDIPDIAKETCSLCKKDIKHDRELVDCRICLHGVHRDCILAEEPTWKFKLDHCMFLCRSCRQKRCSKCSQTEYNLETFVRCVLCKVGLHIKCYEEYEIKPLHTIKTGSYICIPCMTIATERIPELEEDEEFPESLCPSGPYSISDNTDSEDSDQKSNGSFDLSSSESFNYDENSNRSKKEENNIPDIQNWNKERLHKYFLARLPEEVAIKIIEEDLDGSGLLLLQRSDLPKLKLKLGDALKFYKLVRILQTQSAKYPVFWE